MSVVTDFFSIEVYIFKTFKLIKVQLCLKLFYEKPKS